ncbi:glutathione S-transferase [Cyanobium sp. WAJ14-Wanaka]|nr:glutathione S-transferase [Cyanobium sp. WAJ14-Wanaka]
MLKIEAVLRSGSAKLAWPRPGARPTSASCTSEPRLPVKPILYSFRRCPYAIRARLALLVAGYVPGHNLEIREVSLKAKPPELLALSPKATVPVLQLWEPMGSPTGGQVLDQSLAIMHWALERGDPQRWLVGWSAADRATMAELIAENDGPFKHHLDRFKYPDRYPQEISAGEPGAAAQEHRAAGLRILRRWNRRLQPASRPGGWLLGDRPSLADMALLPFVRQFRLADTTGFDLEPQLEALQVWLASFLPGAELTTVLESPWAERTPWLSAAKAGPVGALAP